ncbi:Proteolipid protein 2 [Thecaphora frezii]
MQVQVNPNEDTEFHDALRAHGIIPQKPPSRSPSPELPTESERRSQALKQATVEDLDLLLDEDGVGRVGEEEQRILERLRQQRIAQLATERKRHRFGRVYPITRPDYTREVTEASKEDPYANDEDDEEEEEDDGRAETGAGSVGGDAEGAKRKRGTGVVCFLYKDSIDTCRLVAGYLDTLAAKYPGTKFVSIVGDKCIPNYPDKNLPTLLIYRNGQLHRQIVGLRPELGLDGMKTKCEGKSPPPFSSPSTHLLSSPNQASSLFPLSLSQIVVCVGFRGVDIELLLTAVGVLDRSEVPGAATFGNPAEHQQQRQRQEEDGVDSDEGFGGTRRGGRSIVSGSREKTQQELDDELDWDL